MHIGLSLVSVLPDPQTMAASPSYHQANRQTLPQERDKKAAWLAAFRSQRFLALGR
jgi:hypothetical protein